MQSVIAPVRLNPTRSITPRFSRERRKALRVHAAKTDDGPRVAVVGVTGAVGQEFLKVLKQRDFPYSAFKCLASKRSAGKKLEYDGHEYIIDELKEDSFKDVDIALFSAGGSISKKYGPIAVDSGSIVYHPLLLIPPKHCLQVVDNSSAFRMTDGVPLIIPEVNKEDMKSFKVGGSGIIANPNCSTIIALMGVTPLHKKAGVSRMIVSTYQAASGAGQMAMNELVQQTREVLDGKEITKEIFPFQYAFNLFSHNSPMGENGYNEEEMKMVKETRKIWKKPEVQVTATCIRVPVMRAHAESINLQFENSLSEQEAKEVLSTAPGISIIDDRKANVFPTPLDATYQDDVYVGRIRRDISMPDGKSLDLFVCGDQIRKGAALNAVQIAELLL